MWAGGQLLAMLFTKIALSEKVTALLEYFYLKYIPTMKFHAGVVRSMRAVEINCESTLPGLIYIGLHEWRPNNCDTFQYLTCKINSLFYYVNSGIAEDST